MVIDDGSSPENSKLVLAARKRKKAKTSSYLISTSADDLRKDSPSYVAKVPPDRRWPDHRMLPGDCLTGAGITGYLGAK